MSARADKRSAGDANDADGVRRRQLLLFSVIAAVALVAVAAWLGMSGGKTDAPQGGIDAGIVEPDAAEMVWTRRSEARLGGIETQLRDLRQHPLAGQMLGERLAPGPAAGERLDLGRPGGRQLVLGRARLKFVELELQLVEKALLALRTLAEERATELLDHQLQGGDLRFGVRHLRLGVRGPRLGRRQRGLQRVDVRSIQHDRKRITTSGPPLRQSCRMSPFAARQPAREGRQVRTGLRQSIPSSK